MIDAKELRIGNWVTLDKSMTVDENPFQIRSSSFSQITLNDLIVNPIPLNEEWLLKFGFEKEDRQLDTLYKLYFPNSKAHYFEWASSTNCVDVELDNGMTNYTLSVDVEYVHQLQNLHFALTGKELELT